MGWNCRISLLLLIILSLVSKRSNASSGENDFLQCERDVKTWAESSADNSVKEDKLFLKDLLFFLHVPRTGGRTYFYCFLRKLFPSSQECPRSYDKLRFDPRKPKCRLVVTHDDYSLMAKLPKERTSVITVLRNPIDRVFSTYEFSIEVAARFLVHPNLTSATKMSSRVRPKSGGVSTLDIWPWKYLVPWMREDLFARRDARRVHGPREAKQFSDPYDVAGVVMPLHEYVNDPIAHEVIHNGATFQVAGLTNNSCLVESHLIRRCVRRYPELGHFVLEIAKARLNRMLYIGLTEDHKISAAMFANMVGSQVLSRSHNLTSAQQESYSRKDSGSPSDFDDDKSDETLHSANISHGGAPSSKINDKKYANMTVGKLMETYEACVSSLRKTQSTRRAVSLQRIAPANFTKEARQQVPESVLQQILTLNSLDMELYKHAQSIFMEQQKQLMQQKVLLSEVGSSGMCNSYLCLYQKLLLFGVIIIIVVATVFIVTSRRRTSKIKV